jgi:hypothetical protein
LPKKKNNKSEVQLNLVAELILDLAGITGETEAEGIVKKLISNWVRI